MFSWILSKRSAPKKKKHEAIKRVQNMLLTPSRTEKFYSPTLQQLQCGDVKNVKKISSIYEENDKAQETNKVLSNRLAVDTPLTSRKLMPAFEKTDETSNSKVLDVIKSMYCKDKEYTDWMKKLIDSYVYELEFEAREMEDDERNALISSVFGNIKSINKMHVKEFQPFLESCINDKAPDVSAQIMNFATKLILLCKNGTFICYMLHVMIEKESKTKRESFYGHLIRYAEQKYQFSFNFNPMSQLNEYALLIKEIYNVMHKEKVSLRSVEKMTYAMKEFNKEMEKIKTAKMYQ